MQKQFLLLTFVLAAATVVFGEEGLPKNPKIDFDAFLRVAEETQKVRESRRVTEEKFIELARSPDAIVLDARSKDMYERLHVAGAINLPFSDINEDTLEKFLPRKDQLIVIYCNNNFKNAPIAFASKVAPASLNISTFIALRTYGYTNVYELGPLLDVKETKIELIGVKE